MPDIYQSLANKQILAKYFVYISIIAHNDAIFQRAHRF